MKSAAILILAGAALIASPALAQQAPDDSLLMTSKWSLDKVPAKKKLRPKGAQTADAGAKEGPQVPPPQRLRVPAQRSQQNRPTSSRQNKANAAPMVSSIIRRNSR